MFRLWALFASAYLRLTAMEFTVIPYAVRNRARVLDGRMHLIHLSTFFKVVVLQWLFSPFRRSLSIDNGFFPLLTLYNTY